MSSSSEITTINYDKPRSIDLPKHDRDSLDPNKRLRITEIFYSLQGEGRFVGEPTVFVRLTGCPLRCQYCDSEYAFFGGNWMSFDEVFSAIQSYNAMTICVTGGEPLAQPNCVELLNTLCKKGYQVSLETSGAMDISNVDTRVSRVLDIKTLDSGEVIKNVWENIDQLTPHDQVKFVICSQTDFVWAKEIVTRYELDKKCLVLFSPSFHQVEANDLANWILDENLPVRFQVQLHKYLWNDEPGR